MTKEKLTSIFMQNNRQEVDATLDALFGRDTYRRGKAWSIFFWEGRQNYQEDFFNPEKNKKYWLKIAEKVLKLLKEPEKEWRYDVIGVGRRLPTGREKLGKELKNLSKEELKKLIITGKYRQIDEMADVKIIRNDGRIWGSCQNKTPEQLIEILKL